MELTKQQAEQDFLDASIAVWREIDRLMTIGPYPGIHMATDLRITEQLAWERYRYFLDVKPDVSNSESVEPKPASSE